MIEYKIQFGVVIRTPSSMLSLCPYSEQFFEEQKRQKMLSHRMSYNYFKVNFDLFLKLY